VPARPAANPNTGVSFAVASSLPRGHGLSTWSPLEYLVLCLSMELRRLAPRLLDQTVVTRELDRLADAFPALVRCARERYTAAQLVRVMRALASEGMPIRDLRLLLTALVDFDTIVTDPSAYIVIDDRLPVRETPANPPPTEQLVAAIRSAQKRYITG
jgi:Type III secretory pathway, component EscV